MRRASGVDRADQVEAGLSEELKFADPVVEVQTSGMPRIHYGHVNAEIATRGQRLDLEAGRNLVQAQLLVAQGKKRSDPEIGIARQADVTMNGCAIQCRITTEDPANGFRPDTGKITTYRSPGGAGGPLSGPLSRPCPRPKPVSMTSLPAINTCPRWKSPCRRVLTAS